MATTMAAFVSVTVLPRQNATMVQDYATTVDVSLNDSENGSVSSVDNSYPDFTQIPAVYFLFIGLYFLVMILALSGNLMVCYVVFSNRKMHTVVNYYIVNLAICDFMVGAFVLPVKLLELAAPAEWGALNNPLCTAMSYLQTIFVFASVLTLVATCLERYVAILHPLESRMYQSKKRAKRILLVVWLTPCTVALPYIYPKAYAVDHLLSSQYGTIHRLSCQLDFHPEFRMVYFTFLFFFIYLIPLTFIGGTCFRIALCLIQGISFQRQGSVRRQEANRRKVAKMIMVVVVAFAVSWTPYFLITMVTQYQKENYFEKHNFFFTMMCINLFAFLNSCVNPFIYAAMSSRFRNGFKRFLRIVTCTLKPGKHPASKNKKPRSAGGRYSCAYNRQILLYANDCSQNTSEGSASASDSGSAPQSTAAVHFESVRSLRSLVSCLSLKRKALAESGKPNGVSLTGNGKYVFSELAPIPGSPVGGVTAVEKKLKESGLLDPPQIAADGCREITESCLNEDEDTRNRKNVDSALGNGKILNDECYSITGESVILVPELISPMTVENGHTRRHSIERTIVEFHFSKAKQVHRSASAPSSLLQSALKALLPSSDLRIDNL